MASGYAGFSKININEEIMKDFTDITVVLDRSGSMNAVKQAIIDGFDEFVNKQKLEGDNASLTFVQFDDQYEAVFENKPIKDVVSIKDTYQPRGLTGLLDAIGRTINSTGKRLADTPESDRPNKVIFVIITDGHENCSKEYSRDKVFKMIRHQEEKYRWEFVFIGANQDAISAGATLGIKLGNAMTYNVDKTGNTFDVISKKMSAYRKMSEKDLQGLSTGLKSMFDDDDRNEVL